MSDPTLLTAGRVTYHVDQGIATIRFQHPKSNSLPGALLAELAQTVDRAGADPEARVVVLRSEETGAFCAGASFDELKAIADPDTGKRFFLGFATLILAMRRCPKFVLARIHGKAVGGGVGVAAAADYALAAGSAAVKLSELAVGIGPFVVGPVIEKKIGVAAFTTLAVDATTWRDAAWAHQHGLFAEVHDTPEALDQAVDALATRLAGSSPEAMARMKEMFWEGTDHWESLLDQRAAISGSLVLSDAAQRAIRG